MPSWFKKVFQNADSNPAPEQQPADAVQPVAAPTPDQPVLGEPDTSAYESEEPVRRRVIQAPIVVAQEEQSSWSDEIRIKAQVQRDRLTAIFMVDRPVFDGYSAWFPSPGGVEEVSALAAQLFQVEGVGSVLLHNTTLTITLSYENTRDWEDLAEEIGKVVRTFLKSGEPAVTSAFTNSIPSEEKIRKELKTVIDLEINPGIASHSGVITLERVEGNTVFITMGGGCQGCAASSITLKQGIHGAFRQAIPQVGAIYDETDHAAGTNPFYNELPAGMAGQT